MAAPFCQDVRESIAFDCHKLIYIWSLFQPQVESCWGTICLQLLSSGKQKLIKELAGKWYVPLSSQTFALYHPHSTPAPLARISALRSRPVLSVLTKISLVTALQDNEHFIRRIISHTVALNASKLFQYSNWAKLAGSGAFLWISCQF